MSQDLRRREIIGLLHQQHQQLLGLLARLRHHLADREMENPMVPSLFKSLVLHMEEHFRFEESSEAGESLVRQGERGLGSDAHARQHRELLEQAQRIVDCCGEAISSLPCRTRLSALFEQLYQHLMDHERREAHWLEPPLAGADLSDTTRPFGNER